MMSDTSPHQKHDSDAQDDDGPVPAMQSLLDNPFLLLFIGVAVPAALYLIWGVLPP